jgi:hypothetical protein
MRSTCSARWSVAAALCLSVVAHAGVSAAAQSVPELHIELVFDRMLSIYREVLVSRGEDVLQRLPLDELAATSPTYRSELADFDADGNGDLVVCPKYSRLYDTWLVFRFDPKTHRFGVIPEKHGLRGRGAVGIPAPDLRLEALVGVDGGPDERLLTMVVRRGNQIEQVIPFGNYFELLDRTDPLTAVDVDFDGHLDVAVGAVGNGNAWYQFWRFDPVSGKYIYWPDGATLANPIFDRRQKKIRTWESRGAAGTVNREAVYSVVNGGLRLLWEVEQNDFFQGLGEPRPHRVPDDKLLYVWRIRRRIDDRMQVVCHAIVDDAWGKAKVLRVIEGQAVECRR